MDKQTKISKNPIKRTLLNHNQPLSPGGHMWGLLVPDKPAEGRKHPFDGHIPTTEEMLTSFALPMFTTGRDTNKVNPLNRIHHFT